MCKDQKTGGAERDYCVTGNPNDRHGFTLFFCAKEILLQFFFKAEDMFSTCHLLFTIDYIQYQVLVCF